MTTNDGTQYQYGYSDERRGFHWRLSDTGTVMQETWGWFLEKATDKHGNTVDYAYTDNDVYASCGDPPQQQGITDYALDPYLITYNGGLTRIGFTYSNRNDYRLDQTKFDVGTIATNDGNWTELTSRRWSKVNCNSSAGTSLPTTIPPSPASMARAAMAGSP